MKKIIAILILTIAGNYAIAQAYNTDDSKVAMEGYSPVSYLDLGLAQKGSKKYSSEHNGIKYFFTSPAQKNTFDKNPEKYLPQYGGWCATGIALGAKFRVNPTNFLLKDGKYYLFLKSIEVDALDVWNEKGHSNMAKKADQQWKKLKMK